MSLEVTLSTSTTDASYATPEEFCSGYYALRIDEIEEAVVAGYIEDMQASRGANETESPLASIDATCSPNATSTTSLAATFSIRFVAYASSLFSQDEGTTVHTVKLALNSFFEDKVDSGDWASDRLAEAADTSSSTERRLEDSDATAEDFISPQSVLSVETAVVETLNPTSAPSFWLVSGALPP